MQAYIDEECELGKGWQKGRIEIKVDVVRLGYSHDLPEVRERDDEEQLIAPV